ncbi:SCO family protein [Stigmatella aurantiaca]|uniref:Electron transport protein SCO1/SenC n=1 Tax=Stigmatella aurantiaca (strain DW4/3-1) TaxID=378806 RepID=Q09AY5_STIAD|nr:SCO family protein [Stigmatella aurantiaca]EAU68900.1 electron transport protein SCO1/SenC [Stigmatella aurantiaca DW4/3-1]
MMNAPLQALLLLLISSTCPALALAQGTARVPAPDPQALRIQVPDVPLVNQHGQQVRLWSDLVRGQTVAINFIFTRCKTICSPMTATLARVQKELGPDSPVRFISITWTWPMTPPSASPTSPSPSPPDPTGPSSPASRPW